MDFVYRKKIINNNLVENILEKFLKENENDEEINSLISSCMDKFNENTLINNEELLLLFVKSNNNYNYWGILHKFSKLNECDNVEIILNLIEIIINRFKDDKNFKELNKGNGLILECSEVILKIYPISFLDSQDKCLDIIDNILLLPEYNRMNDKIKNYEENYLLL